MDWRTAGDDDQNAHDLYALYPEVTTFKLEGLAGDDNLGSSIIGSVRADQINGGEGNDFMTGLAYNTSFASITFLGGFGTDSVNFPLGTISSISRFGDTITEVKVVNSVDGSILTAWISDDVESFSYVNESGDTVYYLTEDIARGRIRTVEFEELCYRTYGENSDWVHKNLDTYSEYHGQTPTPEPGPTPDTENPVYRLYNSSQGKHLFSSNQFEIDLLTGNDWQNEGVIYYAPEEGTADVFCFYIPSEGRHFYTALESERDFIIGNQDTFSGRQYEGPAFSAYSTSDYPEDAIAVVRYLNMETGSHVYSTSSYEQGIFDQNASFMNEGIAWCGDQWSPQNHFCETPITQ